MFAACGTSWHAALVGEYLIERLAHLPVEVEFASEFRYRNAPLDDRTLVFVLSQSGETADTLGALREAKRRGHPTLAIVNTVGSTIAREADGGIYLHAGPEVGVASTKAFSAQVTVLLLLALHLGRLRQLSFPDGLAVVDAIESVPGLLGEVLKTEPLIEEAAELVRAVAKRPLPRSRPPLPGRARGRAQAQGDQLHPRRGLSDRRDEARADRAGRRRRRRASSWRRAARCTPRRSSNLEEVKARNGTIITVGTAGGPTLWLACRDVFLPVPDAPEIVQPLLAVVPLQLLAYHVALRLAAISTSRAIWPRA